MDPIRNAEAAELPEHVRRACELALERKARDVVAMDLRGISTATDYFVVATGNSDIQVKAIANRILEQLRDLDEKPTHVEGLETGRWVLLDYIDLVVHVMHPQARDFYQLEALWGDAATVEFADVQAGSDGG